MLQKLEELPEVGDLHGVVHHSSEGSVVLTVLPVEAGELDLNKVLVVHLTEDGNLLK